MKILIIDNYDSFSWNLYHMVQGVLPAGWLLDIRRNDAISLEAAGDYDKIIISPGPGLPAQAGISCQVIRRYGRGKSILGVCLGLQAIVEVYGGRLVNLPRVLHGVAILTQVQKKDPLFRGCPAEFLSGRYHSWVADPEFFPACLEVLATDSNHQIMALRHREYDVKGVQFHPESILSPEGAAILKNWVLEKRESADPAKSFVEIDPLYPM